MKKRLFLTTLSKSFLLLLLLLTSNLTIAQTTYDWLNTAPDGNFQGVSGARWNPGGLVVKPPFGVLRFDNNHELIMNNNDATYNQFMMVFGAGNSSVRTINDFAMRFFDFGGNNPKIENFSAANHVLNIDIDGDGDTADPLEVNFYSSGSLTFNGTINNRGSFINLFATIPQTATFNGVVSGSGGFGVNEGNILFLNNTNTYTGNTEINKGELWINTTSDAIASGSNIFIGNGAAAADVAKIFLNRTAGGTNFTRNFNINPGNLSTRFIGSLNTSGTNEFSGVITNNSTNGLEIQVVHASGTLRCSNNITGASFISKIGLGTLEFSGASKTYTSTTIVNEGILRLAAANQIADTSRLQANGGTFSTGAITGFAETMGVLELTENSTIVLGTGAHNLNFAASNSIAWTAGKILTISGWNGSCNGRIFVGNTNTHLTPAQLLQISFTGYGSGASISASGEVLPAAFNNVVLTSTTGTTLIAGYPTLEAAFTAINGGVLHTGTIAISLFGNTTETTAAMLNQVAGVTAVTIQPSGCIGRTITGNISGNGIIVLNGADNTTINGIARTGLNTLTIINTSTASTVSTSTIRLSNNANNNTINNCTILGSSTGAAYTAVLTTANVLIEGSANGSDNNTISNNDISKAGSNFPSQLIASYGQGNGVAFNDSSTISGNNLFDFFNINGMSAINLGINNNAWTISGNKIYQPTTQTTLIQDKFLKGININISSTLLANRGNNYTITNNSIGFNSAVGTGMLTNVNGNFVGMEMTVGNSTTTVIDKNIINNINWQRAIETIALPALFSGIVVNDGLVNIGTTFGNIIGATTGVASASNGLFIDNIVAASFTDFNGIKLNSSFNCTIQKNAIACLLVTNTISQSKANIYPIILSGSGNFTVIQNNIGSATANSIRISAFTVDNSENNLFGISNNSSGSKIIGGSLINANLIQNITADGSFNKFYLILTANGTSSLNISHNIFKIINMTTAFITANNSIFGLEINDNASSILIENNSFGTTSEKYIVFNLCLLGNNNKIEGLNVKGNSGNIDINDNTFYDFETAANTSFGPDINFIKIENIASLNSVANILRNKFNNISIESNGEINLINFNRNMAATAILTISNNEIVTGLNKSVTNAAFFKCINVISTASAGAQIDIKNNIFSNINSNTGTFNYIGITTNSIGGLATIKIDNNTLSSIAVGDNNLTAINISGGLGNNSTISNNTISGLSAGRVHRGINVLGVGNGNIIIDNNTISGFVKSTHTAGGFFQQGIVFGLTDTPNTSISNNSINDFLYRPNVGVANIQGINVSSSNINVFKNKIFNLRSVTARPNVNIIGINVGGTIPQIITIYNNFIGNFSAPSGTSSGIESVRGINVAATGANSSTKLYFNTIFLTGTGGTNFWTSGITHTFNTTATTNNLEMRNNIIINTCTASGTGIISAFRRTNNTNLNNYNSASNNNVFFAGIPSANNVLFLENTSGYQTMAAMQTRVATRESASISENANFVDSSPAVSDFHLVVGNNCSLNGKSAPISGFTDDIDGAVRDTTFPDPGADEIIAPLTTWTAGTWSPSAPDASRILIFDDDYNVVGSNITACNCIVNSGKNVTIASNDTLTLTSSLEVKGTGNMTFNNGASLVQTDGFSNKNIGNIRYKRNTRALPNNYDFVYWGSPVSQPDQQIGTIWMASNNNDTFYRWNNPIENWTNIPPTTPMIPGTGYIARARNGQTGINIEAVTNTYATATPWEALFKGVPNNGNYTTKIFKNGVSIYNNFNLLGNPYPCALDIVDFFNDSFNSSKLTSNVYFWAANTSISSNVYNFSDYAVFNATTNTSITTSSGGLVADRFVDAGQGFFVEAAASVGPIGADVIFRNSHKEAGNNNAFFRNNTENIVNTFPERHSIWLNLTNTQGLFKQQLVQYVQGATNDFDERFDAKTYNGNSLVDFYSKTTNQNLVIQSREFPFQESDVVALGFKTNIAGNFKIAIDHKDGLFDNQVVYLQDNLLNITHDLRTLPYNFTTSIGEFNNRFVLKYTNTFLGINNPNSKNKTVNVYKSNSSIVVNSNDEKIEKVIVYDLLGRTIFEKNAINLNEFKVLNISVNNQALLVKVYLQNGEIVSTKVVY